MESRSNTGDETEVVYVCSPDREEQLLRSIGSVLKNGQGVNHIVVFCVGPVPSRWDFEDPRIIVKSVPRLFGKYFMGNKVYIGERSAARVVYIDTDTIVQKPLFRLWQQRQTADIIARPGAIYFKEDKAWNEEVWMKTFDSIGASPVPKPQGGLWVFQHHTHQRIKDIWANFIEKYLRNELKSPMNDTRRHEEEWGLALAIGAMKLNYSLMSSSDHSYGWMGEGYKECVVFHTANSHYDKLVRKIGNLPLTKLKGINHPVTLARIKLRHLIKYGGRMKGAMPPWLQPALSPFSVVRRKVVSFLDRC